MEDFPPLSRFKGDSGGWRGAEGCHPHKTILFDLDSLLARICVQLARPLLTKAERLHPCPAAPDFHDAPEPEPLACCFAQRGGEFVDDAVLVEQVELHLEQQRAPTGRERSVYII